MKEWARIVGLARVCPFCLELGLNPLFKDDCSTAMAYLSQLRSGKPFDSFFNNDL
jgi:hypothetical protein